MRNGVKAHSRPVQDYRRGNEEDRDERAERGDHPDSPRQDSPPPARWIEEDLSVGQRKVEPQGICLNRIVTPSVYGGRRAPATTPQP